MCRRQMFDEFGPLLGITEDENDFAVGQAFTALDEFDRQMEEKGREMLDEVSRDNRVAILMIGRPYHNDPGQNHAVLEEFQALGYPILSMRSIPKDREYLDPLFAQDLRLGHIQDPRDVSDVWPENYSVNSVQKVWAAKFAARHPNVAVLDLSSFKCGHDAPTYGLIDSIIASAGKAYSALHDIDANKPSGSIKIRVKTYAHTLMLLKEKLEDQADKVKELDVAVAQRKLELLTQLQHKLAGVGKTDNTVDAAVATLKDLLAASAPKNSKRPASLAVLR
jgi:predicted nucleotide-binding protein (sugar kinase/HSP70/actin superfamily)